MHCSSAPDERAWDTSAYTSSLQKAVISGSSRFVISDPGELNSKAKHGQPQHPSTASLHRELTNKADVYTGDHKDELSHGHGKMVYANGDTFTGVWDSGQLSGWGVMEWANGNRYDGNWLEDLRHGKGLILYENGDRYGGDWKKGLRL